MTNLFTEVNKLWSRLPNNKLPFGIYFSIIKQNIINGYWYIKENIRKDIHTYNLITHSETYFPHNPETYIVHDKVKEIREKALNNFDSSLTPFNITEKQVNQINEKQP